MLLNAKRDGSNHRFCIIIIKIMIDQLYHVFTVKSVFQGLKATKELLKGAKQTVDSQFEKSGTYVEASSDFASVNPTQVRSFILADGVRKKKYLSDITTKSVFGGFRHKTQTGRLHYQS